MPTAQTSNELSIAPQDTCSLWNEIVQWTLEACVQRREGNDETAREVLSARLPSLIQAWSSASRLPVDVQKKQLRHLFTQAQTAVETGWFQRRLIVDELLRRLGATPAPAASAPAAQAQAAAHSKVQLRQRIPFDDIPAMLDSLAEVELESRREAMLPGREVVPLAWKMLSADPVSHLP